MPTRTRRASPPPGVPSERSGPIATPRPSARWPRSSAPSLVMAMYTQGAHQQDLISPDAWTSDQAFLDRPGIVPIQLDLAYDYSSNLALYPAWQAYFRAHQPSTLIAWGQNDPFFTVAGARAYLRDLPRAELHLLDTGHFALEEDHDAIAAPIRQFLAAHALPGKP